MPAQSGALPKRSQPQRTSSGQLADLLELFKFALSAAGQKILIKYKRNHVTAPTPSRIDHAQVPSTFDFVDYIFCNRDLADKFRSERSAADHYLRHGIPEGRGLHSREVDGRFVRKLYGISVPGDLGVAAASRYAAKRFGTARFYPTLSHAVRFNGLINDDFLNVFNHDYYRTANRLEVELGSNASRAKCVVHFCEVGINLALPFSLTHPFEQAFYELDLDPDAVNPVWEPLWINDPTIPSVYKRERLLGRTPDVTEKAQLLRHWINVGLPSGRCANLKSWIEKNHQLTLANPRSLDLPAYQALNPDTAGLSNERDLAAHFLTVGIQEQRRGAEPKAMTAELFTAQAEQMSGAGNYRAASRVFDMILHHVPGYLAALHPAADNLIKQGQIRIASEHYRAAIAAGIAGPWTYINLAATLRSLHDGGAAHSVETAASLVFPEDPMMQARAHASNAEFFHSTLDDARRVAEAGDLALAQQQIASLCARITPPERERADRRELSSIAIVANCDLYQCRVYRVDQKLEQLHAAGFTAEVFEQNADLQSFLARLDDFDAVIFYRVPAMPRMIEAITRANEYGLVTIYDVDDLIFDSRLFPEPIETYGGHVASAEYAGLAIGVPLFAHAMRLCDYGMASTPALAAEVKRFVRTGEVFLHRNGFGLLHERFAKSPTPQAKSDVVTIFYGTGTKAHKRDFQELVEPALRKLHAVHGKRIAIMIVGYNPLSAGSADLAEIVTVLPPIWNIEAYWALLRQSDINVAVVKPTIVTSAKSEIKWLEAAMLTIPSVVSRTETYGEVVEQGKTGFLCDSREDFFKTLDKLVRDKNLRLSIGQAAHRAAIDRYNLHAMGNNLAAIVNRLQHPRRSKLKILVVNVFYPPQAFGGATRVVHDNVKELKARHGDEFEVEVFSTIKGGSADFDMTYHVEDGVRVTGVTTPDKAGIDHIVTSEDMETVFKSYLAKSKPDLIHFHCIQRLTVSVVNAAVDLGIPYFITAHDGWWISDRQFLIDEDGEVDLYDYRDPRQTAIRMGVTSLERQSALTTALFGARSVLAVSEPFAAIYREAGVPNVVAVPNGVSNIPTGARTASPRGRVRLAHVGGTEKHKGLYLIRLALCGGAYTNLELTVVDYAKRRGYVSEETWGTTPVRIVAPLPQSRVGELYENIDVHLACSIWPESFGLVTREAAAYGCWIIASDAGNIAGPVIEGSNGHIVRRGDVGDLTRVLDIIERDPALYRGPTLAQPVLRRSAEQAEDLAALYRQALSFT